MKIRFIIPILSLVWLAAGVASLLAGRGAWAHAVWMSGVVLLGAPIVFQTLRKALRGRFATDVVATLSIVGAIALDQPLAGLVIVLMQSGGEALERFAEGRASAAVRALEEAAPRIAHRVLPERIEDIAVGEIAVGDELLVRPGELVPCDGIVTYGDSELDTSSLTGEAMPVRATVDSPVMSGTINGYGALHMRATAGAKQSQYERIVEMVRTAQASKAPLQRLADRYAVWFTPLTLVICAVAVVLSHDWMRALAIVVVATPCPLILATPVAFIGGINRAARRQIIIRNGGALEQLSRVDIAVFDKTGTITVGKPRLQHVHASPGFDAEQVMRYAASVEQGSSHLLARVLVETAEERGLVWPRAEQHVESAGQGVLGIVDGHEVRVGARAFVLPHCEAGVLAAAALEHPGATLRAYVAIDSRLAAVIEYADETRPDLPGVLSRLKRAGIHRVVLLSGDHAPIARAVAERVGITETYGDLLPPEKATFVERLRSEGRGVLMVGDGVNDAPALSSADVGVALAGHGGGVTTEAADVIILVDALDRVTDALSIGSRTMRIARQSIRVGLGLSGVAMLVAAFGGLPPVIGAGLQEAIDVAVILNALRSSAEPLIRPRNSRGETPRRRASGDGHDETVSHVRRVSAIRA
ncbi:MAG TPA: heavy metal translocating P-type ATPase [Gemmatimonadaceae bacterium]|nr:heavy metal translocating P-type ATPase [Gemmatimonadaceae bacterium]